MINSVLRTKNLELISDYAQRLNYYIIFNALFQHKSTTDFCEWTKSYHLKKH